MKSGRKHTAVNSGRGVEAQVSFSASELAEIIVAVMAIHGTEDVGFCRDDIVDDPFEPWRRDLARVIEDEVFSNVERDLTGVEEDAVERFLELRLGVLTSGGLLVVGRPAIRDDGRDHAT